MKIDKPQEWRLLTTEFRNAFENMAIDEAILKACSQGQSPPTIRFYGWKPHAVSLGYSQRIEETVNLDACERLGIDIVRRATGGRAVLHDEELTYSLISPLDNPLFPPNVLGTYRKISSCLIEGFKRLDINAQMLVSKEDRCLVVKKRMNPSCFLSPSWYEIMVDGKKICGSAQRRVNGAFLQHGSILMRFNAQKLFETLVFKGLGREEVIDYLNSSITSVNEQLGRSINFFELQGIFIEGFQEGIGVELRKGYLSLYEQQLREGSLEGCCVSPPRIFERQAGMGG